MVDYTTLKLPTAFVATYIDPLVRDDLFGSRAEVVRAALLAYKPPQIGETQMAKYTLYWDEASMGNTFSGNKDDLVHFCTLIEQYIDQILKDHTVIRVVPVLDSFNGADLSAGNMSDVPGEYENVIQQAREMAENDMPDIWSA